MRRHLSPFIRDDKDRQIQEFCLSLIAYIENVSKGSELTVEDYILFRGEDLDINPKEIENFLDSRIANGIISDIKCEDVDGVKTYVKTENPVLQVYDTIGKKVFYRSGKDGEREYSFNELFSFGTSIPRLKQLKKTFDEVVESTDLIEKTTDKKGQDVYKFYPKPKFVPDYSVLRAVFKVNDTKPGEEWTLSELLGEKPNLSQIRTFNYLISEGIFNNGDVDTEVKCIGPNSSGEMKYSRVKFQWC